MDEHKPLRNPWELKKVRNGHRPPTSRRESRFRPCKIRTGCPVDPRSGRTASRNWPEGSTRPITHSTWVCLVPRALTQFLSGLAKQKHLLFITKNVFRQKKNQVQEPRQQVAESDQFGGDSAFRGCHFLGSFGAALIWLGG